MPWAASHRSGADARDPWNDECGADSKRELCLSPLDLTGVPDPHPLPSRKGCAGCARDFPVNQRTDSSLDGWKALPWAKQGRTGVLG